MPTRLTQSDDQPSGTASFVVTGPAAARLSPAEGLQIAIVQSGTTERYLDPRNRTDPWGAASYRFSPGRVRQQDGSWRIDIDHGVLFHLLANRPYRLCLFPSQGGEVAEVFTVPGKLRQPASPPPGWTAPPQPQGATAPAQATAPAPTMAPLEPAVAQEHAPRQESEPAAAIRAEADSRSGLDPERRTRWAWRKVVLPVLLLTMAGGVAAAYLLYGQGTSAPAMASMDSCRQEINGGLQPPVARSKADALAKDNRLLDCQFLLYRYAGEKGDRDAARMLGTFYDPDTWSKDRSPLPAPNPIEAARWHKQAAEAGDVESQYRYGMLLKLGRTEEADGVEQAQVWLRRAADAGHVLAKTALEAR